MKTPPDGGEGWLPGAAPVLEPSAPLHGPFRKPRDIYPLPLMCGVDKPASFECSRKSRRRIEHSQHLVEESNLTIRALNSMYGSAGPQKPCLSLEEQLHGEAAAQWSCLEFIQHSVQQMGKPPTDLDCRGALRALQTASGYEGDQPSGSLASFNIEAISLPDPGWKPIDLAELWGDDGRHQVNEFVSNQLLPPEIARAKLGACGVKKPYSDPLLRQGRVYHSFLNRLHQSSLVDFSLQPGLEQTAFFCVTKKSGKLRLIVDARRSNACFKEPDHVELATGEGLGALEMAAGSKVTIGMADLKDAFYHLSLPMQLRPYFSLPRVRAGSVGIDNIAGVDVAPGTWLTPRLAVVPMGWSWALYLCQSVHECLAERAGLGEANRIRDRKPPPSSVCCHTQYVDNMIVIGTNSELVTSAYETAVNCLKHAGLQVHEEELGKGGQLLGWEITDHGTFRPTRHRAWKVRLSIRGLLKRGRCSAHLLEKLIGHCSFLSLGRRECFSIFGDVYSFIQTYQRSSHEFPLWKGVRRELMTFDGAIPLIQRDLTSVWSPQVLAVDASEFGLGATQARFSVDEVRRLGQVNERWRFKDPLGRNPRQRILQEQYESVTFGEGLMVVEGDNQTDVVQESGFSNVPFSSVNRDWVTVGLHRWRKKSSLPVYEGRASLFAVKHILRSKQNFGKRHVILSDSLTATCAISRGRSPQFNLRRVCSQIGALALATGSYFCIRWIPSEWNPADNPSRGKWSPVQFFGDGLVSAASTGNPSKVDIQQHTTEGGRKIPGSGAEFSEGLRHSKLLEMWPPQVCPRGVPQGGLGGPSPKSTCRRLFGNPADSGTTPYPDASTRDADRPEWCQSECEEDESKEIESRSGGSAERANHVGRSLSVKAMPFSLFSALGFDQAKDSQRPGEVEVHEDGRQRFNKAPGRDVSRWRRYQFSPVCHSRCTALCAKPAEQTEHQPAESETVFEGIEQIITTSESASGSLGSCLHAGDGEFQIGEASLWSPHSSHVLPVLAANRVFETESMRPCPTKPEGQGTIPVVVIGPTSSRRGDPLKDHGIRRGLESRPGLSSRSWDGSPQLSVQEGHSSGAEDFHTLQRRSQHIPQPSFYSTGASGNWSDPSLQVSSWRSFARLPHKTQRSQCSPVKGALEMPCFGSKISEGIQVGSSLRRSTSPSSKVGKQGGCRYQPCSAKPALSSVLRPGPRYQVFLEIFSGCGRLGKTIARDNNWPVLLWDICLGERYDLRSSQNRRLILGWIRAGFIIGGHCGTPCNSFSRARDRRPGPPPLRSDTMVMGLPGLAAHDQIKVSEGNLFMRFTVQIMMLAASLMLPWTFENPARSRIWLTPPVLRMLRRRCCTFTIFEMCMFGTSWRKPTAIAAMHVSLERLQLFRCLGSKRGCCKRTGMPHTQLCGQTPSGEWKTHAAQKYPFKLCKALASCFYDYLACRRADNFSAILAREP